MCLTVGHTARFVVPETVISAANLTLCDTVRHSKPRPVPHCQAQQNSPVPQFFYLYSILLTLQHRRGLLCLTVGCRKRFIVPDSGAWARFAVSDSGTQGEPGEVCRA